MCVCVCETDFMKLYYRDVILVFFLLFNVYRIKSMPFMLIIPLLFLAFTCFYFPVLY